MGADIEITNERLIGGEAVADIRVRAAPLRGIDIPEELVPLAIDEFPALFVAAACAEGETILRGAADVSFVAPYTDALAGMGVASERYGAVGWGPSFDARVERRRSCFGAERSLQFDLLRDDVGGVGVIEVMFNRKCVFHSPSGRIVLQIR